MASLIRIKLARGLAGSTERQRATAAGLGLGKRNSEKILKDTVPIRGMIMKIQHLLEVERFDGDGGKTSPGEIFGGSVVPQKLLPKPHVGGGESVFSEAPGIASLGTGTGWLIRGSDTFQTGVRPVSCTVHVTVNCLDINS